MSFRSTYADIDIPDLDLHSFLFGSGEGHADPAIVDTASLQTYSFAQLADAVDRVAAGLAERGLGHGDVAALFSPNCADYPVVFHGIIRADAVASTVNCLYTEAELAHQLRDAGAKILFASTAGLERARAAVAHEGVRVEEIIVLGPVRAGAGSVPETAFADLLATRAAPPAITTAADDLAALPYSSGTTGLPKGVMLTHRNLVANLLQADPLSRIQPGSRLLAVLPLSHIYAMTGIMNQGLRLRATTFTMPRFDLAAFLAAIAEHRIDHLYVVPPIALALATSPLVDEHDLTSLDLVMSAAAPLDARLARAVGDRLGATVVQGYGLTECSPCTHGIPPDRTDIDRGSIGILMPNVQARVVDPTTGEDAAPGQRGEMWCRGPNVMRGYLNNPEATAATVDSDGYLHTGDVVTVDDGGVFRVVDRLKELIKYNGYQIAPAELEAVLLAHEAIADVAVIGAPGPDGGEIPKAFITRETSHPDLTAEEVLAFAAAHLAPYKKIREVAFVDQIPKSPTGKILRKELRQRSAPDRSPDPEQAPA
ncbi:AMP-binding protein [Saccharopolyspora mangrovi]|uniref:AMP-binding protein n=1 Tax=Saccharopolyspora mangrovi TaxID=3082379 RepID=A0ABU6ABW8_9PSEU|nr:AMP-binding protein [Saccharopolyspora sp. S2-29]MEB3369005.1 AMP-binding protein [Saccharopolyspora sp. S2-29]